MSAETVCPGCNGEGTWFTECCNGAGGCSCRGGFVDMGQCRVCGGYGTVPDHHNPRANIEAIQGYCFAGSGPSDGSFWDGKPSFGGRPAGAGLGENE